MKSTCYMNEREFWDKATKSTDLRNEWICDKDVTDEECLVAIMPYLKPGRILDLGCGIGRLTQGYGVDISPKMLQLAKPGNQYRLCRGRTIPWTRESFKNVFSVFMFQHIPDEGKISYIREVYRVLLPKGVFRFQYVEGSKESPFSYDALNDDVAEWLADAGFNEARFEYGTIHPKWTWVTAIK